MPREGSEGTNHTWSQEEIRILYNCAKAGQRPEEIARQSLRSLTPKQISNKLYSLKKSTQGLTLPIPSERRRASAQDGAKQAGRRRPDQTATQTVAMADAYAKDPVKDGDAGDDNDAEEGNTDDSGDKQKEQAMANFETLVDLEMIAVKQMPDAVHIFVRTLPGYSIGIEVEQDCARLLYKPYRYGEDLWTVSSLTLSEAMDLFEAQGPDYTPFEAMYPVPEGMVFLNQLETFYFPATTNAPLGETSHPAENAKFVVYKIPLLSHYRTVAMIPLKL